MSRRLILFGLILGSLSYTRIFAHVVYDLIPVNNSTASPGDDPSVPDFNDGSYYTFDLVGTVLAAPGSSDTWWAAVAECTLGGPGTFFLHPEGTDIPSDSELIEQYPSLEYDTYFSTVSDYPPGFELEPIYSGPGDGAVTGIECAWYETHYDNDSTGGTYTLARFTVQTLTEQSITLTVTGAGVSENAPGPLINFGPFVVTVPEPRPVLLLGVVTLLLPCRRWRVKI